jgi:hypothetical protein
MIHDSAETSFLKPPGFVGPPDESHGPRTREFQGIPSLAESAEGRLWATWYAGPNPSEDQCNYVVVADSEDAGSSWTERTIIDPDAEGPVRAFDPELWVAPDGVLWSFWNQAIGHNGTVAGVWAMTNHSPDRGVPEWSPPRRLTDGVMMCKPTVLSTGEWVLPASTWRETDMSARMVVSTDSGRTWSRQGACHVPEDVRSFDEHMIVERKDSSLWMLIRTEYGIGESTSLDRGTTWQPLEPSGIEHPSSRFFARRLQSGNILLVKNGALQKRSSRSHLSAYVSRDDGHSWSEGLLLDERDEISYPDGQQGADGTIRIIYDRSRTGEGEILMAAFGEDDVIAGIPDSANMQLRRKVSRFPAV